MNHPDYVGYEAEKRQWIESNPTATPEQYQRAIVAIAARFGV